MPDNTWPRDQYSGRPDVVVQNQFSAKKPPKPGRWRIKVKAIFGGICGRYLRLNIGAKMLLGYFPLVAIICPRRLNFDHLCRLNFDQGSEAVRAAVGCG